jgi:hypothetical protein
MLEHHPVRDRAAVTAPRVTRGELRRLTAAMLVEQRTELDPGWFQQA